MIADGPPSPLDLAARDAVVEAVRDLAGRDGERLAEAGGLGYPAVVANRLRRQLRFTLDEHVATRDPEPEPGQTAREVAPFLRTREARGLIERLVLIGWTYRALPIYELDQRGDLTTSDDDHARTALDEDRRQHVNAFRRAFAAQWRLWSGRHGVKADLGPMTGALIVTATTVASRHKPVLAALEPLPKAFVRRCIETLRDYERDAGAVSAQEADAVDEFEARYRARVHDGQERLAPPHAGADQRLAFQLLYVEPYFLPFAQWSPEVDDATILRHGITARALLPGIRRLVVVGNPGAGKSTFGRYVLRRLAEAGDGAGPTPLLVVLRDYINHQGDGLEAFIAYSIERTLGLTSPKQAIELLLRDRALIVFDGLDEMPDVDTRRLVRDDIERFCDEHPLLPVVVTSRVIGYDNAPLDDTFTVLALCDFVNVQVADYAERWFSAVANDYDRSVESLLEAFLEESEKAAPDLRRIPLLLSLLCILYLTDGSIPERRAQLYEDCSRLLLGGWDKSRGVAIPAPLGPDLEPTVEHLARWIFGTPEREYGISEDDIVRTAADALVAARFGPRRRPEAIAEAELFCQYCRDRASIIVEIGTDKREQPLFQFTHRTFLEYFAALSYVRSFDTSAEIAGFVADLVVRSDWLALAELCVAIEQRLRGPAAADQILREVLRLARTAQPDAERALVTFAAISLSSLLPSHTVVDELAESVVDLLTRPGFVDPRQRLPIIRAVIGAHRANQDNLQFAVGQALVRRMADEGQRMAVMSCALLLRGVAGERSATWMATIDQVLPDGGAPNLAVDIDLLWTRNLDLVSFLRLHGPQALFTRPPAESTARQLQLIPVDGGLACGLLRAAAELPPNVKLWTEEHHRLASLLGEIGDVLPRIGVPWAPRIEALRRNPWEPAGPNWWTRRGPSSTARGKAPLAGALLGLLVLAMPFAEQGNWEGSVRPTGPWFLNLIAPALTRRPPHNDALGHAQPLLGAWQRREISVLAAPGVVHLQGTPGLDLDAL